MVQKGLETDAKRKRAESKGRAPSPPKQKKEGRVDSHMALKARGGGGGGHLKDPSSKPSCTGGNFQAGLKFQSPPTPNPPTPPTPAPSAIGPDQAGSCRPGRPRQVVQASWAEITVNTRQRCKSRRGQRRDEPPSAGWVAPIAATTISLSDAEVRVANG